LNDAAMRVVETRGVIRRYEPDAVLWQAGGEPQAMHVVLEGEVRVVRGGNGRQRVVHHERRGGTLGDVALFAGSAYPATAIAATRVVTIALTRDVLHAAIAADPALALTLLRGLSNRVRHLIDRLDRQGSWTVQARVAQHLLERAAQAQGNAFTLGMTQQQLAEELGTAREVIVREIRALREMGLIQSVGRGRFRVLDADSLRLLLRQ
jgi:CRP/FNR family transcriptional regulator